MSCERENRLGRAARASDLEARAALEAEAAASQAQARICSRVSACCFVSSFGLALVLGCRPQLLKMLARSLGMFHSELLLGALVLLALWLGLGFWLAYLASRLRLESLLVRPDETGDIRLR